MAQDDDTKDAPSGLDDFGDRLEAARSAHSKPGRARSESATALGRGFRLASELIAAFLVAGGLGLAIDRFAGSAPFGLLVGIAIGFAAGLRNVSRAMNEMAADAAAEDENRGR